jgi:hypothetical protein
MGTYLDTWVKMHFPRTFPAFSHQVVHACVKMHFDHQLVRICVKSKAVIVGVLHVLLHLLD